MKTLNGFTSNNIIGYFSVFLITLVFMYYLLLINNTQNLPTFSLISSGSSNNTTPEPIPPPAPIPFVMSNIIGGNSPNYANSVGTFQLNFDNPLQPYTDVYFNNLSYGISHFGGVIDSVSGLGTNTAFLNYTMDIIPGFYEVCFDINNPNNGNIQTTCSDPFEIQ